MRKRLIEKFTKAKEGSFGYTMTELLVVVAIIAIVAAIAIPSVIAISRALKFKRVNDHAKSIFLAAQQNLTEMRSDGGLKPLQEAGGSVLTNIAGFPEEFKTEYVYTTQGTTAFELILPVGSVDGTVRSEQIIIEYNPITGNVYSVFYSEEDESILGGYQSQTGLPREDKSARKDMMLGYYDGSGLNSSQLELEEVRATVEFVNGEEGIVRVLVPVPDDFFGNLDEYAKAMTINLSVTGEYSMVQAAAGAAEGESGETAQTPGYVFSVPIKVAGPGLGENCYVEYGNTIVVEYPIDSLVNYGSFANYSSSTYDGAKNAGGTDAKAHLTDLMDETRFTVLPGENVTLEAEVKVDSEIRVEVENGILSGVNPMFEYLQPSGTGGYVLAVSNGRNLQNLNAIAPTIAKQVDSVVFTSDIYWNDTVSYYNDKYGNGSGSYANAAAENPARALPYFVPIHHEDLFGTAKFIFPTDESDGGLGSIIQNLLDKLTGGIVSEIFGGYSNPNVPTLTDEMDTVNNAKHASIQGNGYRVLNLNVDSTKYMVPNDGKFYATGTNQLIDYSFSGLFGYVNTPIDDLHIVNPIIKGKNFEDKKTTILVYEGLAGLLGIPTRKEAFVYNNPATGALLGAGGFNTLITDCSTYIDKNARGYIAREWGPKAYSASGTQDWYGVSGEGAVGGLVGYAKSHRSVTGELTNNKAHLAFSKCFAALPVSGNMRGNESKHFGYSNGVGAFIGNSQLTNFYNCYASGDVMANGCYVDKLTGNSIIETIADIFGYEIELLYNGRTSMGAGGFVGTSHGTRYTNCFATGSVSAAGNAGAGAGGFVGFMSIDETRSYGNDNQTQAEIAQRTIFTNCYSVGVAVTNSTTYENFSGANGRIVLSLNQSGAYAVGDYYQLYAPVYVRNNREPNYTDIYFYRDTYFLSNYHKQNNSQASSSTCAEPEPYSTFEDLVGNHGKNTAWTYSQIQAIKDIVVIPKSILNREADTYQTLYFDNVRNDGLTTIYRNLYDEGYSAAEWNKATASTTHPYSMPNGSVYPFTKLAGMDYYGDWPSKPSAMGLAYYEAYATDPDKNQFFFDKEHDDNASLRLNDGEDVMVVEDGYAIFSANNAALTVTVNGVTDTLSASSERYTVSNSTYHVFYLTDKLMKALPANGEFYCTVTAKHTTGDTYTMYFNPGVAISHVNPTDGKTAATKPDAAPKTIYVRSARQFKAIAALEDFWGKGYSYIQQLNIDAVKYSWADAERKVSSIGNAQKPFQASYSAGYTVEGDIAKQYKLSGFLFADNAAGFFGTIGKDGSIENLIVECDAVSVGGTSVSNVAVLAGRNEGTISNVDMVLKNLTTLTAADNAGLLAGYSSGTVRDCEVSAVAVTVNAKNGGGLIGSAEGTANAKAKVSGCKLTLTGDLTVSGTGNAGGLIGQAKHLNLTGTEPLVSMTNTKLTADNAAYAGGLAGWMEDSEVKITDAASVTTVTFNTLSAKNGVTAGFLGGGKNVAANGVDVTAGTVSGKVAAGLVGTGTNVDAEYCDVVITNSIQGETKAAGVAGTIGAQSVFNYVTVNHGSKVTATNGNAAGYAVELAAETDVMNGSVTLNNTTISASGNAAGYACSAAGYVGSSNGSSVPSSVVRNDGKNIISGANAAGFACEITGQVSGAFVTPALDSSKYRGNSNENLVVNGTTSAAGFALTVGEDATVTNCYALDKITGGSVTGFVGTNKGTITGCMANVTISGGNAFVATNDGTVTRCYGWYGDGDASKTETNAEVGGKVYSAYFADLNPVDKEGDIVTLYAADGKMQVMTATELQGAPNTLAGSNHKWYTSGYESYPYTPKPANMSKYLYPMLRDHYGDWITPPQYAYGVVYYETYEVAASAAEPADAADVAEAAETPAPTTTAVIKLHMVDLSDSTITEEKQAISTYLVDQAGKVTTSATTVFNNEYTIKTSGYAVFGKKGANVLASMSGSETPLFTYTLSNNKDAKNITYEFFPLKIDSAKDGTVAIGATAVSKNTAAVQAWFADAINVTNNTYQVRTPEQLANIAQSAAASFNFNQTHDITVDDFTTAANLNGNYNGNGLQLTVSNQQSSWITTVGGSVTNLKLQIANGVNAPIFGTVNQGANVTLTGLNIGAVAEQGALVNAVAGSMTVPAISTSAVNGKLFGNVTGGSVTVDGAINVTGTAAKVFGDISSNGNTEQPNKVTVNGLITTGDLTGNAIGAVSAKLTLNGISVGNVPAEKYVIAGITSGTVSTGDVTVKNVNGQVFGEIKGGTVNVGAVSTQAVDTAASGETPAKNANIFGDVSGGSVTVASINTNGNAVNGNVFGTVGGSGVTVSGAITTGAVTGNVFGDATAAIKTGDITVNGDAGNVFGKVAGAETGNITVSGNAAQVFGAVNAEVSTGAITTGKVTNVFGDVESGKVTTQSIAVNGAASQIFGDVKAPVEVIDGITTAYEVVGEDETTSVAYGDVGQVFGEITLGADKAVNVGGISVGNVTGSGVIASVGNDKDANAGTITLGTLNVKAVGTSEKNANIIGNVNGGAVTATSITAGNVSGNIVGNITSGTVTTGGITVTSLSGKLAGSVDGTLTGTADSTKATISLGTDVTLGKNLVGTVSGTLKNYSIDVAAINANVIPSVSGTVQNFNVSTTTTGKLNAPVVGGELGGTLNNVTVDVATASVGANSGILVNSVGEDASVIGCRVEADTASSDAEYFGGLTGSNAGTLSGNTVNIGTLTATGTNATVGGLVGTNGGTISGTTNVTVTTLSGGKTVGGLAGINSNTISETTNVTVTTLSGSDTVGGLIAVNSNAINGTVTVNKASISGGKTMGGLIGTNSSTISGTAKVLETTITGGENVGGLVATNNGTISSAATVNVTISTGGKVVGGLVATHNSNTAITGANVTANITYTGTGGVTIGGIVGEMKGGSLTDSKASGSINVDSTTSQSGKGNIIGGAVGKAFDNTTYSGTTSTVSLTGWGKATLHNAADVTSDAVKAIISPDGNGPIGQFVGYAATGTSFSNCAGNGGSATYQFLGQVQHTDAETFAEGTYGEYDAAWGTKTHTESTQDAFNAYKETHSAEGKSIAYISLTLSECYYTNATNSFKQTIGNTKYYADGTEGTCESYTATPFNPTVTETEKSKPTVGSFSAHTSQSLTTWYYKHTDGNYYPVWARYDYYDGLFNDGYGIELWADLDLNGSLSDSENFDGIDEYHYRNREGNSDKNKAVNVDLYKLSDITIPDGKYLIVGGGSMVLSNSGAAVKFASSFTTEGGANADLVGSVWNNAAGVWSSNGKYLNLNNNVVGEQKTLKVSMSGSSISLNGGKYLTYNGSFSTGDKQIGAISLYSVAISPVYEMTFTNDRYGQVIGKKDMGVIPAALSEETIPAEEIGGETGNNT